MPYAMAMPRDGQRELASQGSQAELGNQKTRKSWSLGTRGKAFGPLYREPGGGGGYRCGGGLLFTLVPKLRLGTKVPEAPASRRGLGQPELARRGFPSRSLGTSEAPPACRGSKR